MFVVTAIEGYLCYKTFTYFQDTHLDTSCCSLVYQTERVVLQNYVYEKREYKKTAILIYASAGPGRILQVTSAATPYTNPAFAFLAYYLPYVNFNTGNLSTTQKFDLN